MTPKRILFLAAAFVALCFAGDFATGKAAVNRVAPSPASCCIPPVCDPGDPACP